MLPSLRVLATSGSSDPHVADTECPLQTALRPEAQNRMVQGLATRTLPLDRLGSNSMSSALAR